MHQPTDHPAPRVPALPRVRLGHLRATRGAVVAALAAGVDLADLIDRHAAGDWGDVSDDDRRANTQALASGARLLSAYTLPDGGRLWILTEADRSATTVLLPEDY